MATIFTNRNGVIQIRDAAGYGYNVKFDAGDFRISGMGRTQAERVILDRGALNANARYVVDTYPVFEPTEVSFSFFMTNDTNPYALIGWMTGGQVSGVTFSPTFSSTMLVNQTRYITSYDRSTVGVTNPAFFSKQNLTCDVVLFFQTAASNSQRVRFVCHDVHFPPSGVSVTESKDGCIISAVGKCYSFSRFFHNSANAPLQSITNPTPTWE